MNSNFVSTHYVIECFIMNVIPSINEESEVPGLNFIFNEEGINYINSIIKYEPNYNNNFNCIKINNAEKFFSLLTDICNEQTKLENDYGYYFTATYKTPIFLRRIWLKMGIIDFECIESFLEKQLEFIKRRDFDKPKAIMPYDNYMNYKVYYKTGINNTYCESTRKILFCLGEEDCHDLPSILYDILEEDNEKICYIYAIQNEKTKNRNKSIERSLYKINKNHDDIALIHPNFTTSMLIFIDLLKKNDIYKIKVPLLQVLSYDYHVLLTDYTINYFKNKWTIEEIDNMNLYKLYDLKKYNSKLKEYEMDKTFYKNCVHKEELISKNKTDNLINLMNFLSELNEIEINSYDIDDTININIKNNPNVLYREL